MVGKFQHWQYLVTVVSPGSFSASFLGLKYFFKHNPKASFIRLCFSMAHFS